MFESSDTIDSAQSSTEHVDVTSEVVFSVREFHSQHLNLWFLVYAFFFIFFRFVIEN